jgi:hypothetical protein
MFFFRNSGAFFLEKNHKVNQEKKPMKRKHHDEEMHHDRSVRPRTQHVEARDDEYFTLPLFDEDHKFLTLDGEDDMEVLEKGVASLASLIDAGRSVQGGHSQAALMDGVYNAENALALGAPELAIVDLIKKSGGRLLTTHSGPLSTDQAIPPGVLTGDHAKPNEPVFHGNARALTLRNIRRIVTQFLADDSHGYRHTKIPASWPVQEARFATFTDCMSRDYLYTWLPSGCRPSILFIHQGEIYEIVPDTTMKIVRWEHTYGYDKMSKACFTILVGHIFVDECNLNNKSTTVFVAQDLVSYEGHSCVNIPCSKRLDCLSKVVQYYNEHRAAAAVTGGPKQHKFLLVSKKTYSTVDELKELEKITKRGTVWCEDLKSDIPCSSGYHAHLAQATYHETPDKSLLRLFAKDKDPDGRAAEADALLQIANITDEIGESRMPAKPHAQENWRLMQHPCAWLSCGFPAETQHKTQAHKALSIDALFPLVRFSLPLGGAGALAPTTASDKPLDIRKHALSCDHAVAIYKCEYVARTGKFEISPGQPPLWSQSAKDSARRLPLCLQEVTTFETLLSKFLIFGSVVQQQVPKSGNMTASCFLREHKTGKELKNITLTLAYVDVNGGMLCCRRTDPRVSRMYDLKMVPPHDLPCPSPVNNGIVAHALIKEHQASLCDKYFSLYKQMRPAVASCRWDTKTMEWRLSSVLPANQHAEPMPYDALFDLVRALIVQLTLQDIIDAQSPLK